MKLVLAFTLALLAAAALADPIPSDWQASGLRPIGYTDLNGRRGGIKRWVLYKVQRKQR